MRASVFFFNFFTFICSFPFKLNWKSGGTVEPIQNRLQTSVWMIASILEWINLGFVTVTLVRNAKTYIHEERIVHITIHSAWCSVIWICSTNTNSLAFFRKQLREFVNEAIRFQGHMKGIKLIKGKMPCRLLTVFFCTGLLGAELYEHQSQVRSKLLSAIGCYCIQTSSTCPLLMMFFRDQDWLILNVLTPEKWMAISMENFVPILLVILVEVWFEATLWGGSFFIINVHLHYLQTVGSTLVLLRNAIPVRKGQPLIKTQKILTIYSEIRILTTTYNSMFRSIFWPLWLTASGFIFIGGLCTFFKIDSGNMVLLGFISCCVTVTLGFLIISSVFTARIHTESDNLHHWLMQNARRTKCDRALCASFKSIGVEIGSFYVVRKQTLFTLMGILTNATASALLSMRQLERK